MQSRVGKAFSHRTVTIRREVYVLLLSRTALGWNDVGGGDYLW